MLGRTIRNGSLKLIDARGREHIFGDGSPPNCTVHLHDRRLEYSLALNPALRFGEAYMDGTLTIDQGTLPDVLDLVLRNYANWEQSRLFVVANILQRQGRKIRQYNPLGQATRNVAHHYDLSKEFYELFLDPDCQYSCAYFETPGDSLEEAQANKKRHISAKLLLQPGQKILDIGSGWGGLAIYLAKVCDVDVTGVTLSSEQCKVTNERLIEEGLSGRVQIRFQDYRTETRVYDRIVSVGMFEHVGKRNYAEFFTTVYDLLAEDGVFLLHTIGRYDEPAPVNPFIRKYIFPGTDIPCLSELFPIIERTGFVLTDLEVLRLHYAKTLHEWRKRFTENWEKAAALYDDRFCRMWELYLTSCEMGFRHDGIVVYQIQLAKKKDAVPLTRDYIADWKRANGNVLAA
jgi:cyclopropane-fatty-acyl-phospholipid synthase